MVGQREFSLKAARLADAERIFAIVRSHPDELVPKPMGDIVASIDRFVVAEADGEIVGCATYSVLPEIGSAERATVELQSVAVSGPYRKLGIGRALVECLLERIAAFEPSEALVLTFAPGFFSKLGFEEIPKSRVMHKLYSGCLHCTKHADPFTCPEIAMAKNLKKRKDNKMDLFTIAQNAEGLSNDEIAVQLEKSLEGRTLRNVLIIPPDFTRYHSNAGFITCAYYKMLTARGVAVDVMPALGTHVPVSAEQWKVMFPDVPYDKMIVHGWRTDVVKLGEVPAEALKEISDGLWTDPVSVEVNRRIMDEKYDLIISPGQVVPHEVIGMANHAKNLFVGCGGADMINKSHMIGAVCGMEKAMGRDHTPVRRLFDYAFDHFVAQRPILWVLTVNTAPGGKIHSHGLFIGEGRNCLTEAVKLAQEKNIDYVEHGIKKCVVYLDPSEFTSTWLGNKSVYRTRMAMADGGELIVLAPGVHTFGEDKAVDALIRKYGYKGRLHTLEVFKRPDAEDLRANMGAAAHLIHGSSDGRFTITYCVKNITKEEIEGVGFKAADYDEMVKKYDPAKLQYGYNTVDGEEIYFIPNPALGLWINRERFNA